MENNHPFSDNAERFSFFALGILIFWWLAYFLAVLGVFSLPLLGVFGITLGAGTVMAARKWLTRETLSAKIFVGVVVIFSSLLMYVAEPTILSGRDQGSISEAAFELVRTGSLSFSSPASGTFSAIYGEGKALNFPGFFYRNDGSLTTQFPLGYTVFLASFTAFFDTDGFRVGNGLLLTLSILSLFLLVRTFANERYAIGASAIFALSFLPSWFAKFTLTENAALFLFLFLALNLVLFLRENRTNFFLGAYLSALMLAVTRIEGIWMLAVAFGILFFSSKGRTFAAPKKMLFRTAPLLFGGVILFINFFANLPFFVVMAKAFLKNFSSLSSADPAALADSAGISLALWKLFAVYGLLPVFLIGFAGAVILLRKKRFVEFLPMFLALPTLLYFVDPNITHDHPWMLRRFLPFAFPALLLTGTIALSVILEKHSRSGPKIALGLGLLVLAAELPASIPTLPFADNRGLLDTTATIAPHIGGQDLLLVDRTASGDAFSMPIAPLRFLHEKNVAYFFNPEDYAKIAQDGYEHIYLLTPPDRFEEWVRMPASFQFITVFSFSTEQLEALPLREARFPQKKRLQQDALLFELKPL